MIKFKKEKIIIFIFILCIGGFIYSGYKVLLWLNENKSISKLEMEIKQITPINETIDNELTEIINNEEVVPESNPYWDYIKMKLIDVDFTELKKINSSTVGWIQVNGTNINYPFVQAQDNNYYLNHSIDKSWNSGGWVFLDYRNNNNDYDRNTIIYAHSRLDGSLFNSLRKILNSDWYENVNNYIVKLSTEYENTLWQVFSVYRIPTTSDYLKIQFSDDEEFLDFATMLKDRSTYDFSTTIAKEDKIVTLSTCYNDDEKVVMHAKLIKRELK